MPMSVKTRRASEFFEHPQPDRLLAQVAAEAVLGDGVQIFEVEDQERPAAVQVRPKLIHHQFFDIFTHGFGSGPRMLY